MCGLAGVLNISGRSSCDEVGAVKRMLQAQVHRGPDDTGLYNDRHVVLGHRRLAIIDLSAAARQPMSNEDGTVWTICNGEIYNYRELRQELTTKGHTFSSNSDTEVIVHGYEEWGIGGLLDRLVGMFAFVIYHKKVGDPVRSHTGKSESEFEVFLVRDRLGKKPLYYSWDGTQLLFSSELKGLMASGLVEQEVDGSAIQAYLMFGSVPSPMTMVRGVKSLEPASYVRVCRDDWEEKQYWRISFNEDSTMKEQDVVSQLRRLLLDSVKCRLISDVPLGVFLSGGIDSSAILSLMTEVAERPIRTYSLAFQEPEFNEGAVAKLVAQEFDTEHVELEMTAEHVLEGLPDIFHAMDQPTIDGVNTYFVSKLARQSGAIVALSGIGGDELFGGYPSFKQVPRLYRFSQMAHAIPGVDGMLNVASECVAGWTKIQKLKCVLQNPLSPEAAYLSVRGLFLNGELASVGDYGPPGHRAVPFSPLDSLQHLGAQSSDTDLRNMVSLLELRSYMHNQLLRDTDVMSMAHGLEVRVPLLDHRLVEFLTTVPTRFKFTSHAKQLLLKAIPHRLPAEVTTRPKRGFTFPFERWFRGKWRPYIEDSVMMGHDREFNGEGSQLLWNLFLKGKVHWSRIWCLVVLQLWLRQFKDQCSRIPEPHHP